MNENFLFFPHLTFSLFIFVSGFAAIFERFRGILHEGEIDKRVQYTIENLFAVRKNNFSSFPAVPEELDLVEENDQITHELTLDDELDREEGLGERIK